MYESIDIRKGLVDRLTDLFEYSEILPNLLQSIATPLVTQQEDLRYLMTDLLNIDVAEKSQLDLIGDIIGQPRLLIDFDDEKYFGMKGSYNSDTFSTISNPNIGGYWNSYSYTNTATAKKLNDVQYRRLLKARAIYNNTNCTRNELIEVVNLLTNNTDSVISVPKHRRINIKYHENEGLLTYFLSRVDLPDNILPVPFGVTIEAIE